MKKIFNTRRGFLLNSGKAAISLGLSQTILPGFTKITDVLKNNLDNLFVQKPLAYRYDSLQNSIDALTMEIHYTKHAAGYCKNLNDSFSVEIKDKNLCIEKILNHISFYSTKMRNNAGGHFNHEMFWQCLTPKTNTLTDQQFIEKINADFGSFENFKTKFNEAAKTRFGSGWAWLVKQQDGKLAICSTANQDNPLMDISDCMGQPLLCLDVWEHAYYLKYQNKRADYINNFWNLINWNYVTQLYKV